jgi:hypothetical protein
LHRVPASLCICIHRHGLAGGPFSMFEKMGIKYGISSAKLWPTDLKTLGELTNTATTNLVIPSEWKLRFMKGLKSNSVSIDGFTLS